jgi:hypothetical protein
MGKRWGLSSMTGRRSCLSEPLRRSSGGFEMQRLFQEKLLQLTSQLRMNLYSLDKEQVRRKLVGGLGMCVLDLA